MKIYEGIDFSDQTVELTEQTQFLASCDMTGALIIHHNYGYELLGCPTEGYDARAEL